MIGKKFQSEKSSFIDKNTGNTISKLTNSANNFHFYFTDNSFLSGDKEIIFLSDRGAKKEHQYNFFKMNLDSGEMTCLSDEEDIEPNTYTKTPDGEILLYKSGLEIKRLNIHDGSTQVIYRTTPDRDIKSLSIKRDKNK